MISRDQPDRDPDEFEPPPRRVDYYIEFAGESCEACLTSGDVNDVVIPFRRLPADRSRCVLTDAEIRETIEVAKLF